MLNYIQENYIKEVKMKEIAQQQNNGFSLNPTNLTEAMKLSEMLSSSSMVPKQYLGKSSDTLIAMMLGVELRLNPIQSLQNIAVINGRPALWGDSMLALVQNHPQYGGVDESFDDETMTATCTAWRKGSKKQTSTFSQQDAQLAKLWGKQGPWSQYPKRMLQLRARGFALRNTFADALSGLISAEEARDIPGDEIEINPIKTEAPKSRVDAVKKKAKESAVKRQSVDKKTGEIEDDKTVILSDILTSIDSATDVESLDMAVDMARLLNDEDKRTARTAYVEKLNGF